MIRDIIALVFMKLEKLRGLLILMRFKPTSKADKKIIKKALQNKTYTYGTFGMKKLPFKTDFKKDLNFMFTDIFPQKSTAYAVVSSAVIISGILFYICDLKTSVDELNKRNQVLVEKNNQLNANLESVSNSIVELDQETKEHMELIQKQKEELTEIEKSYEDINSEKDAALKEILDMIKEYDIFSSLITRSGNFYSATNQIQEAKSIIQETLGDTEEAEELIAKLDKEKQKIEDYRRRYPDYKPVTGRLTSRYGYRRDPFTGQTRFHNGIDIGASTGTSVYSAAYGTITYTGYNSSSGNHIIVDHGNGFKTYYKHLSKILVKNGDVVNKGQRIGLVGSTGRSTGPHLHFEIHLYGSIKNPLEYVYYN